MEPITTEDVRDGADNVELAATRYADLAVDEQDANRKKLFEAYAAMLAKLSDDLRAI